MFRRIRKLCFKDDIFTEKELADMQKLTYLSKKQILKLYKHFCTLEPDSSNPKNPIAHGTDLFRLPELRVNPLRDRIVKVFSTQDPYFTFEDFLDLMSVYSSEAPLKVKASYAFRIFDLDDDDMLSKKDIRDLLNRLNSANLVSEEYTNEILRCVFSEADLDSDGFITYPEFEHLITKSPDFLHSFRITV
ncbi:hypothetical protein JTE90_023940 [Oedothorax gibbosus]|uniref:EF-hand domain-containing protein n=1 Tax=Oedothorax gibbosus TaxID=931172 RepID=A0AAV6UTD4_9ARAC|nr:hypothetical protein JTE90_023940 [Oedothorax gibbosus]